MRTHDVEGAYACHEGGPRSSGISSQAVHLCQQRLHLCQLLLGQAIPLVMMQGDNETDNNTDTNTGGEQDCSTCVGDE